MFLELIRKIMRMLFTFFVKKTVNKFGSKLTVNFYSRLTSNTVLGNNVNLNGMIIRGNGKVRIGNNFHSGKDVLIINSFHKYDFGDSIPYDKFVKIDKDVIIEDNVWIGDRVIILGGVTIGEGVIIQAGAVVVNNISKYGIAGGNPAKVFKNRDIDNYNKLKNEGRFM